MLKVMGWGISRWTYRIGVAFKNNLFGRARGKMQILRWRVLCWRLMLTTTTRFTGNILNLGCEGLFGERECPSMKDFVYPLYRQNWIIIPQDNSEEAFTFNDLTVFSYSLLLWVCAPQYFDKNPLMFKGSLARLWTSGFSHAIGHN